MFPKLSVHLLAAVGLWAVAGCGAGEPTAENDPSTDVRPGQAPADERTRGSSTRIRIIIEGERFGGVLDDSAASRDLLEQLPLTVTLRDIHGVEKAGKLPRALSTQGKPAGTDPEVGDIGYYAPWQNLVLYYGDQGYHEGILVLGYMEAGVERLARMRGDVQVKVARVDG